MCNNVKSQRLAGPQKRKASGFGGFIGLFKVFLFARLQPPGSIDIDLRIGP